MAREGVVGMRSTFIAVVVVAAALVVVPMATPATADVSPPVVDVELSPGGGGYWLVDGRGAVTAVGAPFHGDRPGLGNGERVVSMTPTLDGGGYWLFTSSGRVFTFGNATHHGDMAGVPLNGPVIDSIATADGGGYYMVASDGGIFSFGSARFYGSMGGKPLNAPVNGLAPTADGKGYWLVADDGGIFSFGSARFYGSMGGTPLNAPVVGMVGQGDGYLMVGADGGIFNFGASRFHGSLGGQAISRPVTAVAVQPDLSGYVMVSTAGTLYPFGNIPDTGWPSYPEPGHGFVGAGTHRVGSGIAPGTYRVHPNGGSLCYWERTRGFSGEFGDILANSLSFRSMIVTIEGSDAGFHMSPGCWLAVADLSPSTSSPDAPFGSGSYFVHRDVRPGTWQADASGSCYWERKRSTSGELDDIIANDLTGGRVTVTIEPTDLAFEASDGCGTWTKIG